MNLTQHTRRATRQIATRVLVTAGLAAALNALFMGRLDVGQWAVAGAIFLLLNVVFELGRSLAKP